MEIEEPKEILQAASETYKEEGVERVTDFRDAGVLGWNKGLVIKTEDGSEFQLTTGWDACPAERSTRPEDRYINYLLSWP